MCATRWPPGEVSERFVPRLALHRDRITAAWRDRRSLCEDVREVLAAIENEVYRGAMFKLNEVIEAIHHLDASGGAPAAGGGGGAGRAGRSTRRRARRWSNNRRSKRYFIRGWNHTRNIRLPARRWRCRAA